MKMNTKFMSKRITSYINMYQQNKIKQSSMFKLSLDRHDFSSIISLFPIFSLHYSSIKYNNIAIILISFEMYNNY